MRALVAILVLLSLGAVGGRNAGAADAPLSPEEVATQVKAAHAAGEAAKIAEWASKDAPDPWLVADALLASGAHEAAEAFAKAAPRKDVERLPELVAGWKALDGDAEARLAIRTVNAALEAQKPADALLAAEAAKGVATPVVTVRLLHGQGLALMRLDRAADAASRFEEVVTLAEGLGWLARAAAVLDNLAWAEVTAKRPEAAVAAARRRVSLETARGNRSRTADALRMVGHAAAAGGANDAAIAALEQAVAMYDDLADAAGVGQTRNDLAEVLLKQRDYARAEREILGALGRVELLRLWPEVARSHALMGQLYRTQKKGPTWPTLAISSYEEALAAAEKTDEAPRIAALVFELGRSYGARDGGGDQEKALTHHLRAVELFGKLGNRQAVGAALTNAADSNLRLGRDDVAQEQAERVVALARELVNAWMEGRGQQLLGELAERQKKPEQALAAYRAALARFDVAGDRLEAARCVAGAAEALRLQGDLPQAREHADRAAKESEALRDRGVAAYAGLVGARIRRDQGLHEEALMTARDALGLYRSVNNPRGVSELEALIKELEAAPAR